MQIRSKWVKFFTSSFELENLRIERCIKPENAIGDPMLVIYSDGSDLGYGCVAYVRWECDDDTVKSFLVMAKSKIAPMNKIFTPRSELNRALLAKRARVFLCKEMRYNFK